MKASANVPTLSGWAMALLALAVGVSGYLLIRGFSSTA